MSQIPAAGTTPAASGAERDLGDALQGVDLDAFFQLMIAELQNQDPLNPLENDQLLQQVSQIREVGATEKLTETLDSVLLGQNVTSATALIGKHVRALTSNGKNVEGVVDRVTISDGEPSLHIGTFQVPLSNVAEVRQPER